jgi:UDP-N-acetyl-D-mannosaminuronate dehydrogenase
MNGNKNKIIGILGYGEIGKSVAKLCKNVGFQVLVKDLVRDQIGDKKVDFLHVNIPEKDNSEFVKVVVENIKLLKPQLTVINSSVTPGTTRKIFLKTKKAIVHSPVIGLHPYLYKSIKYYFPKIVGPVNEESKKLAINHFVSLGLKYELFDSAENSEASKLLDLVYYAWNIIYCKWMKEVCDKTGLNFDQVYTQHNLIYNKGYKKLLPNAVRPIFYPGKGPIGGHCTIPDTVLFNKYYPNRFTQFILDENKSYQKEVESVEKEREKFIKTQRNFLVDKIKKN